MPQPHNLPELTRLAEELLSSLRAAAHAVATGQEGNPELVNSVVDTSSRFTTAAAASPDLARAVAASPGLAALSLASKELANLASASPQLAELAVMSPNLARVAAVAPEMADLAKASPHLAATIETMLARGSKAP